MNSVDRAIDVLEAIEKSDGSMTVTEIAAAVGASKSAAFATLFTLVDRGILYSQGHGAGRVYRLGFGLVRLGQEALAQVSLRDAAMPALQALTAHTQMSSRVVSFDGGQATVVGQVNAPGQIRLDLRMGQQELPHCSAVGKALLAQMAPEEARAVAAAAGMERRTEHTITDLDLLMDELELTRHRGYALDCEEDADGIMCVGAPIWDHAGANVGAISVTGLRLRAEQSDFDRLGEIVKDHAARLTHGLQGRRG